LRRRVIDRAFSDGSISLSLQIINRRNCQHRWKQVPLVCAGTVGVSCARKQARNARLWKTAYYHTGVREEKPAIVSTVTINQRITSS
jgi:hypothetical protein